MAGRKSDFTLTKLDDLFSTQEQRDEEKLSKIRDIPLTEIDDFPDHPFKVRDDEDMAQLIESIKERGVITPATVRQKEDGRYELISGHRRKRACELAGFDTLRCEVVELNRDEATILMVESNYQRSQILPSEKAYAYKMRLEALSRQGKGYEPREKPDERFYDVMRELSAIGNNINQLAAKANTLGFVDAPQLKKEAERWHKAAVATQRMKQAYIATKEKAERSVNANSSSAEEYASDKLESGIDEVVHDGAYAFDKAGRKGLETTKENIRTAKDGIQRFKQQRAEQSLRKQASQNTSSAIKTVDKAEKTIKQSATSSGKKTIKFAGKEATKTAQKSVKTAEQTAKTAIKTSQQAAKAAQKTAQATVKASQKAAQAAKATAKATAATIKAAAKATVAAVKAIIAAVKGLVAAIAAGGWVAVVVIIVLCLVGLIAGSVFGIFFSGEDSGTGMSMQTVVQEINQEYDDRLEQEKNSVSYDVLEMSGSRAVWKEVLAVYSVKVNTDPDNPMEVATVDETKKQLLSDIFWEMNDISSQTETKTHTEIEESDDGHGNIVQTETTVTETFLYITVTHKTVDEMAAMYGFNQEQKDYLAELLKDENNQLWSQVLYGIGYSDDQIVTVALSQVGNVGGQPYWSWYGFDSRVEWCACFVSWCANECGYIDAGIIPKYAGCVNGVQWFRDRGQWADGSYEPSPGTIIFFDWEGDGVTDHTGIVQRCENGTVYTVEGNSGDTCRTKTYPVGSSVIYGYGIPAY